MQLDATISRLRALPEWNRWITFCAQGQGSSPDSIHRAEIRLVSDVLEVGIPLNIAQVTAQAGVHCHLLMEAGSTRYSLAGATPREAVQILDALFRYQFGIRPFPNEDNDYAVSAEW